MSRYPYLPCYLPHHLKYTRTTPLHFHPYYTTIPQPWTCRPLLIGNSYYWPTKSTNPCLRTSPTRRYPHTPYPRTNHYRNNQPIYSSHCLRSSTYRQSHSWPSFNSTNRHSCFRSSTPYANCSYSYSNRSSSSNPFRGCRSNNSSLRLCTPSVPLPPRKRLMAHQAHAYHIVDPSPWPLTGAIAALLITSGLAT